MPNMLNKEVDSKFTSQACRERGLGLAERFSSWVGLIDEIVEFTIAANEIDASGNCIVVQRQQSNLEAAQTAAREDEERRPQGCPSRR